jgi:pyruvate formate lyase activating enzyme
MTTLNLCVKEALCYEKKGNIVTCTTCERRYEITLSNLGFCRTRKNIEGNLFTLIYGDISSYSVNPIEKKPFFHFYPGSRAFTVGSWGCNFTCLWCQNYDISKKPPDLAKSTYLSPEQFISFLKEERCHGTSISFNEPTLLLEYAIDVFALAKQEGYYNTYVTNGYMTDEALKVLVEYGLDAVNFDVKGDKKTVKKYCNADSEKVWRNIAEAHRVGVHIEITTLIIPKINDTNECLQSIAQRIHKEVGEKTPWHITQYYPAYKALELNLSPTRTPIETLENAWKIGREEGLRYVYIGNVPGHPYENTFCPQCNALLINRSGFDIINSQLTDNHQCPKCKEPIPIISN